MNLGYPMENSNGSIDVPFFFGDDPEEWIAWVESYGSDEGFSDFQMRQFAHGFIEGDALAWYYEEISQSPFNSWEELKAGIFQRFGENKNQERLKFLSEIRQLLLELKQLRLGDSDSKQIGSETNPTEANTVVQIAESESCFDPNGKANDVEGLSKMNDENSLIYPLQQILEGKLSHDYEEQSVEPKRKDVDRAKHACQVFDQMPIRGKGKSKKKKKKRWKELSKIVGSASCFELNGDTDCMEMLVRRKHENMNIYSPQVLEEKLNYEAQSDEPKNTGVTMSQNAHQVFEKMTKRRKKMKFTKAKGFKYKSEMATQIWKKLNKHEKKIKERFSKKHVIFALDSRTEHKYFRSHRKQWSKEKQRSPRVYQVFLTRFMQGKHVKKKRKMSCSKYKSMKLDQEKLLRNLKKSKRDVHQLPQLKGIVMRSTKKLGVRMNKDTYMEIVKRTIKGQRGRRMRKRNHGKLRRWKYKPGKWGQDNFQSHVKRDSESQSPRRMKGCRRWECCCMVLDELLLGKNLVKTKKLQRGNKVDRYKRLDVLLLNGIKGATKKNTLWINGKRQGVRHKQKRTENWKRERHNRWLTAVESKRIVVVPMIVTNHNDIGAEADSYVHTQIPNGDSNEQAKTEIRAKYLWDNKCGSKDETAAENLWSETKHSSTNEELDPFSNDTLIACCLICGDGKFHLKHKWKSRMLQTLSGLEFFMDKVLLITSSVKLLLPKNHKLLHPEAGFCTQYNDLEQLRTDFQSSQGLDYFTYLIFIWNQALCCGCEADHRSSGTSMGDVHGFFTCSKLQTGDETQGKRLLGLKEIPLLDNNNKIEFTIKETWVYKKPMTRGVFHLQRPPELVDLHGNPAVITKVLVRWKKSFRSIFKSSQWQLFKVFFGSSP